jgi:inorganic pyrophosphatase
MQFIMEAEGFWHKLDELVRSCPVKIDRPRGSSHPRHGVRYPLDYGYLQATQAADGGGIDVWVGSLPHGQVTGVVCTIDVHKRDAEIKILLGCTSQESHQIAAFHNAGAQAAVLVERPH